MGNGETAGVQDREAVVALHRAGHLKRARTGYERLLTEAPEDSDLLGLLGVVALQERNAAEAEALLRRAVRAPHPDAGIHLRNLNNLFVLLLEQDRTEAAAELAEADLPDWPDDVEPDADAWARIASLAEALGLAGRPERGARFLESVLPNRGADRELHHLAGRLWLESGDAGRALPHLQHACAGESANWQALAVLSVAQSKLDLRAEAKATALRCAQAAPVYIAPQTAGQEATILVLNPTPAKIVGVDGRLPSLHFTKNFISQASRMLADDFRFASVFADLPDGEPELPEADLVFNNLASGEVLSQSGRLERATALVERIGLPVINPPEAVVRMTRQKGAELLQGIPGLLAPHIVRYWRDLSRFDETAADIARQFSYPVIVRHVAVDSSSKRYESGHETAVLVDSPQELWAFLERVDWPQFYVIQYVDLRKADGNYRKIRATFVGDEIIVSRCQFHSRWMVGGQSGEAFYGRFPECATQMHDIIRDPEAALGIPLMSVLRAVRDRVPLDFFGMDFDVDDEGRVVLFEAQSTMSVIPNPRYPDYAIAPKEPSRRILEAFRQLVRTRIAAAA